MGMYWVGYRLSEAEARAIAADEDRLDELLEAEDNAAALDLDKAWHGVHWLLTGSADPTADVASGAILGGEPVGEDSGYGPPRLLDVRGVAAVAAFLAELDTTTLRGRFDPAAMASAGIYPAIWDEDGLFDEYLAPSVDAVREFYAAAAEAGQAVLQLLT